MKFSNYIKYILKDFFIAYGCLMIIVAIFLSIYSTQTIKSSLLWQIILMALAYTFFKFAVVNKYEFGKKAQMINLFICSTLADIMIIIWLWLFSPSKIVNGNLILAYIIIILVVKGFVYAMIHIDDNKQAKQLNEKLNEYKSGSR